MSNDDYRSNISSEELGRKVSSLEIRIENASSAISVLEQKVLVLDILFRGDRDNGGLREQVKELEKKIEDTSALIDAKLTPIQKFMWTILGIGIVMEIVILPIILHYLK